jgi:hypothetical protein
MNTMSLHTCREDGCAQRATDRCFDCGDWLCATHLIHVKVPTAEGAFAEVVCSSCLQEHLAQTDPYGKIVVVSPPRPAIFG